MKKSLIIATSTLLLTGCAGGFPPSSDNGLNIYDVLFGYKEVPEGADNSRVWSPVHQIYGGKPEWSVIWFKEQTRDGTPYELTAKPTSGMKTAGLRPTKIAETPKPEPRVEPVKPAPEKTVQAKDKHAPEAPEDGLKITDRLLQTASVYLDGLSSWISGFAKP